jgi:peptidyl-Lys metalloendopeptidase
MKRGTFGWIAVCGLALGVSGCKHAPEKTATPEPTAPQTAPQQPTGPAQGTAPSAIAPAAASNLACALSVTPTARAGAPVEVTLKLTNHSAKTVYVLRWQTPLEGQLLGDAFHVTRAGAEQSYKGAMAKRGSPSSDNYAKIAPKGSVEGKADLSQAYGLTTPGRYRIEFRGTVMDFSEATPDTSRTIDRLQPASVSCPSVETVIQP